MENMKNAITFDFNENTQKGESSCDLAGLKESIFFDSPDIYEDSSFETYIDKNEAIFFETIVQDEQGKAHAVNIPQVFIGEVPPTTLTLQEAKELGINIDQHLNANIILPSCLDSLKEREKENNIERIAKTDDGFSNPKDLMDNSHKFNNCSEETISNSFNEDTCSVSSQILSQTLETFKKEKNILCSSKNVSFPEAHLPEPHIYAPAPLDLSEFLDTEIKDKDERNIQLPVKIYKEVGRLEKIKSYKNDLYIFKKLKGIYQKLSSQELHYLINEYYGDTIERQGNTSSYYMAEDFLRKQSSLVVNDADLLPLEYWGFPNGFYNIYNGARISNDGTYFVRHVLQYGFQTEAVCPNFDNYIYSIAAGDKQLITRLWEVIGYLLSNDTNGKVFIVFVGRKDTGKSLLANIISRIVGENDISYLSANDFSGRFDVSELNGKHLNICMDLPDRALSPDAVGKIKSITGNDVIRSDVKHKESISFKPTARLLFGSNAPIRTELPDPAFYDRLIVIPFLYPVPKDKQDHRLEEKLVTEASGICLKAMEYYKKLRTRGYVFTEISLPEGLDASINYNTVIQKFADCLCELTQNADDKVSSDTLYTTFNKYCSSKNIAPLNLAEFSKKFKELFGGKVEKKKIKLNGSSLNGFTGIKLRGDFKKL
ncbi:MAG: hypothetical protein F8N38_10305 [Hungatella sp.]|nr:hypothetical protein [Hungatella sp.]